MHSRITPQTLHYLHRIIIAAPIVGGAALVAAELAHGADPLSIGLTLIVLGVVTAGTTRTRCVLGVRMTRLEQGLTRVTGMQEQQQEDLLLLSVQQMGATEALRGRLHDAAERELDTERSGTHRLN